MSVAFGFPTSSSRLVRLSPVMEGTCCLPPTTSPPGLAASFLYALQMPQESKPVNWRAWLVGILVAVVLIVALQNSQQVSVEVLFASFHAPLIVVILLAAAIGALIGYVAPLVRRHHRREERQQHKP
jgi:uncharacterized integral membrane protein